MKNNDYVLKIIVLAAGKSERFNDIKLLAKVKQRNNSTTLIEHVLHQISNAMDLLTINETNLLVATGGYHPQIAQLIGKQFSLNYCENAHYGIGHTIAQSVEKIVGNGDKTSHIMITLADQIALNCNDYTSLIKQSLITPEKLICAKSEQEIMPPAIFPSDYFSDLMSLTGDRGAKSILYANQGNREDVILPNAAIDIDTKHDLINWQKQYIVS